jgi:hypothetical protein
MIMGLMWELFDVASRDMTMREKEREVGEGEGDGEAKTHSYKYDSTPTLRFCVMRKKKSIIIFSVI